MIWFVRSIYVNCCFEFFISVNCTLQLPQSNIRDSMDGDDGDGDSMDTMEMCFICLFPDNGDQDYNLLYCREFIRSVFAPA